MKNKKKDYIAKLTAKPTWWSNSIRALSLSSERSTSSDTVPFLSCALFSIDDDKTTIESTSGLSTTFISVGKNDDILQSEGSGEFLIPINDLQSYVQQLPSNENIDILFYENTYDVVYGDESIVFSGQNMSITDDDSVPQAEQDFPDDAVIITCSGKEFIDKYKSGSVMAKSADKDPIAGQSPLSGCIMTIDKEGMRMLSLTHSGSETFIEGESIEFPTKKDDISVRSLSFPAVTLTRANVFSYSETVRIGIGKDKFIHIADDHIHMCINSLDIGKAKDSIDVNSVVNILKKAYQSRVVTVQIPSKEFFSSLARASTVQSDYLKIEVSDTLMKVSAEHDSSTSKSPFRQTLSCSSQWYDDGDHYVEMGIDIASMKKLSSLVDNTKPLVCDVAFKDEKDGTSPWAMTIYDEEDFDPENPHNFFMILLRKI